MNHYDIDNLLANESRIKPSSAFLASVMNAVEREAASLPPSKFPWLRALPGFLAAIVAITAAIRHGIGLLDDSAASRVLTEQLGRIVAIAARFELQWLVLAVAITIISLALSWRLVPGRNYA